MYMYNLALSVSIHVYVYVPVLKCLEVKYAELLIAHVEI